MDQAGDSTDVVVYTRARCVHSMRLRFGLKRRKVRYREVDIWKDLEAAASVRAVANGNETVPTVVVGDRWLVNPSAQDVVDAIDAANH
jgi:mycoredoxin